MYKTPFHFPVQALKLWRHPLFVQVGHGSCFLLEMFVSDGSYKKVALLSFNVHIRLI